MPVSLSHISMQMTLRVFIIFENLYLRKSTL